MTIRYQGRRALKIPIDTPTVVELPPRVFCGRLIGMLFDTDKTFVLPGALRGIAELKQYYDEHPGMELLIVGHTDSVGRPEYNVELSRERARTIASFLRDDVDDWLANYRARKPAGKRWGTVEDQLMLQRLAGYDGNIDGKIGPRTREAIRRFQEQASLPASGNLDDHTRRQLVTEYLAQDGTSLPANTPTVIHGAGSHHPADQGDSDGAHRRNRRVEIFLSDGPLEPAPGAPAGPEYDAWVRACTETIDFQDAPEELIELELEWPSDLVDRLPDDLVLELSGRGLTTQARTKADGVHHEDAIRFTWQWLDRDRATSLRARAGGKHIELWRDQICGDLASSLEWSGQLDALARTSDEEDSAVAHATGAGNIPDDLRSNETLLLRSELV